jgi:hypothetical protein
LTGMIYFRYDQVMPFKYIAEFSKITYLIVALILIVGYAFRHDLRRWPGLRRFVEYFGNVETEPKKEQTHKTA